MSLIKKIVAGALTLALAGSMVACSDTTWAAKINDYEIRAGLYIYIALNSSYFDAQEKLPEGETDLFNATIDGKDASTWIKDDASEKLLAHVAVEKKFDELGLTLSETDLKQINMAVDYIWEQGANVLEANGISKQSVIDANTNVYKRSMLFDKFYAKDGLEAVPDADIQREYVDNNFRIKTIAIQLKDGEGNLFKSAEKAEAMKMAEEYKSRATKANFDDLIKEYDEYYADVQAKANSSSSSSSTVESPKADNDEFANETILVKNSDKPNKKICDAIFEKSKVGVPTIIEDDEVYYVVMRYDIMERKDLYEEATAAILRELKEDEFNFKVDEWKSALTIIKNEAAYKRYNPEKFIFEL